MVTLQENIKHSIKTGLKSKLIRDKFGRFYGKEVMLMYNQLTVFDIMYPKYKINKPIRLIELFALWLW